MTTADIALNVDQRNIAITEIENEPRARDLDIGKRLGLARPRVIRDMIKNNVSELEAFGPLAVQNGKSRGQEFTEYWLNEEQALLVATLSNAPNAATVRAMLIRTFVAWRRGHLGGTAHLPAEVLEMIRRDDGISRMLAHKVTGIESTVQTLATAVAAIAAIVSPAQPVLIRRGKTAGQIWRDHGFPRMRVTSWFSNRLCAMQCQIDGGGRGELGLHTAKLFDPDKADNWLRNGGAKLVLDYIATRQGQGTLRLVPAPPEK